MYGLLINNKLAIELAKSLIQKDEVKLIVNSNGDIQYIIDEVEFDFTDIVNEFLIRIEKLDQLSGT